MSLVLPFALLLFYQWNDPFLFDELFRARSTSIIDHSLSVNHPALRTP
jgi:hypothetical protein